MPTNVTKTEPKSKQTAGNSRVLVGTIIGALSGVIIVSIMCFSFVYIKHINKKQHKRIPETGHSNNNINMSLGDMIQIYYQAPNQMNYHIKKKEYNFKQKYVKFWINGIII